MKAFPVNPKIILAGAVSSSQRILKALLRNNMNVNAVFGLAQEASSGVSGYARLDDLAQKHHIPYHDFKNINQADVVAKIRSLQPDLLFAVGLSQLVKAELLDIPAHGCIGFHPTQLPQGRGRAPIAWLILEGKPGAATFFLMDENADAGPILAQAPFAVGKDDYAADVIASMEAAIDCALNGWLPHLKQGIWKPIAQDESRATFYGKRTPADGLIDWKQPAQNIYALIRAASRPHPGAFTFSGSAKLIIWRAEPEPDLPYHGVPGRILLEDAERGWLIQTGDGLLWISEVEYDPANPAGAKPLRIGVQLGISIEDELISLQQRISALEARLIADEEKPVSTKGNRK